MALNSRELRKWTALPKRWDWSLRIQVWTAHTCILWECSVYNTHLLSFPKQQVSSTEHHGTLFGRGPTGVSHHLLWCVLKLSMPPPWVCLCSSSPFLHLLWCHWLKSPSQSFPACYLFPNYPSFNLLWSHFVLSPILHLCTAKSLNNAEALPRHPVLRDVRGWIWQVFLPSVPLIDMTRSVLSLHITHCLVKHIKDTLETLQPLGFGFCGR